MAPGPALPTQVTQLPSIALLVCSGDLCLAPPPTLKRPNHLKIEDSNLSSLPLYPSWTLTPGFFLTSKLRLSPQPKRRYMALIPTFFFGV